MTKIEIAAEKDRLVAAAIAASVACAANKTPETMTQFEIGRTYSTRSICDHNCIFSFTILARTAKTVTVEVQGKTVRRGLSIYSGVETFKPFGSYSMAASIHADDKDLRAA